jgi:hypothetical protein
MLRIRDVYPGYRIPDPNFSIQDPGSRVDKIPDPHQRITVFLTQKTATKFSKIGSSKFILDSGPGVKKAPDPGSGSATLV